MFATIFLIAVQALIARTDTAVLQTDFTITVQGQPLSGSLISYRGQFHLTMPDSEAACDSTTLYIWQQSIDELTLSTPTQQDREQVIHWLTQHEQDLQISNTKWLKPSEVGPQTFRVDKPKAYLNDMR